MNNDWRTDGNWDVAGTPGYLDDVVITSGTPTESSLCYLSSYTPSPWGYFNGHTVALSGTGSVTLNGGMVFGYTGTATWTQSGGDLSVGEVNMGGNGGSGTFNVSGGTVLSAYIHFSGGPGTYFNQSGGSVTGDRIDINPSWHQQVNGAYNMTGGTLTLTGPDMIVEGGESGPNWVFNFGGGDIYLGGDQSTIATADPRFNITGDPLLYQVTYHAGTDTTHLFYIPEPATLALLGIGGLGMLLRRRRRS